MILLHCKILFCFDSKLSVPKPLSGGLSRLMFLAGFAPSDSIRMPTSAKRRYWYFVLLWSNGIDPIA